MSIRFRAEGEAKLRFRVRRILLRAGAGAAVGFAGQGCLAPPAIDRYESPKELRQAAPATPVRHREPTTEVKPASWVQPVEPTTQQPKPADPAKPLEIPEGLPGAEAPQLNLPPNTPANRAERLRLIDQYFPEFAALGPDPLVDGEPGAKPVTFEELLEFAIKHSPEIAQASADVADAHGRWVQAGLYPNPVAGFQGDQMFDFGYAGQLGGFFNQTIVTAGKLTLARAVAYFDFVNARVRMRKVEVALAQRVRKLHNEAMVAAENVRVARMMVAFTDEVYRREVALVKGGTAAPFEASALLALTGQAELALTQSRNRYAAAWKQLAAAINSTDLRPAPLAGRVAESLPRYHFESIREQMLANHTNVIEAKNLVAQAERGIAREQVKPIPDLLNQFYFQHDTLAQAAREPSFQMGAQIGVAVPLFDRNQGAIMAAKAQMARALAEVPRVENALVIQLAEAFERYETARQQAALYREKILPNLATAFRGVYQRYQVEPDKVNYNDIVVAQQNLGIQLAGYLNVLQQQWQAQADVLGAVQVLNDSELSRPENPPPDTWPESIRRSPKK